MSDHASAEIFGNIFKHLSKLTDNLEHKELALKIWHDSYGYDFSFDQMDADEALIKLGLARNAINPKYPEEGKTIQYMNEDNDFEWDI